MAQVDFASLSNIIIDDIVLWDGRTHINTLGGGGTHAVVGMRVWTRAVGLVAAVGEGFPEAHREALRTRGIDLEGVIHRPGVPMPRAWQIIEPDERRVEVFRTPHAEFLAMLPRVEEIPSRYLQGRGFHLLWGDLPGFTLLVSSLRRRAPHLLLLWEPTPEQVRDAGAGWAPALMRDLLGQVDVFSPNAAEALAMTGEPTIEAALQTLRRWGYEGRRARGEGVQERPVIAVRMGKEGALIVTPAWERPARIPAVPASVVDVTGAGNAYCGGFLVGYAETGDPVLAGRYGAVSASFAVEQFGIPFIDETVEAEARRRLASLAADREA